MDTNTATVNFLDFGSIVQEDGYTMQEAGTVQLAGKSFQVEIQEIAPKGDYSGSTITWLIGARGAKYTLEPVSIVEPNGVYRVMSFANGSFLRLKSGKELRVVLMGNVLEVL